MGRRKRRLRAFRRGTPKRIKSKIKRRQKREAGITSRRELGRRGAER